MTDCAVGRDTMSDFFLKYPVIVLDFDGVIIDSAKIKTDAFAELFNNNKELIEFHKKNTGISRFVKFRYYYENILKEPVSDEKLDELNKKFNKIVMDKIKDTGLISGIKEFLERYWLDKKLYICSGAPINEVMEIVKSKDIIKYFKGIYGQPGEKNDILNEIADIEKVKKDRILFIGDGLSDYEAAKKTGIDFIAFIHNENKDYFEKLDVCKIYESFLSVL
ncbi:MAG: HAD-IA family hydrolase [Candidatus Hydrogenedentota bacterium]